MFKACLVSSKRDFIRMVSVFVGVLCCDWSCFIVYYFYFSNSVCVWVNACQTTLKHFSRLPQNGKKHEIGLKYQQCLGSVKI